MLAGIISDFGSPTGAVEFGGRGEFDGVMTGAFRSPRVEGLFTGEDLRAFDTLWGDGSARIVVENRYVNVRDGVVRRGESEIRADGLFSLGYPRAGSRRTDQRAHSRRAARSRQPAARVRHRRLPGVRAAVRRVPPDRRVRAADRLRRDDDRRRRRLRRAVPAGDLVAAVRRHAACGSTTWQLAKGTRRGHRRGLRRLGLDLLVQRRRAPHSGGAARVPRVPERAAVGHRGGHGQRQRHVRRAAQRLPVPRQRSVRRRGRGRAGHRHARAARQRAERRDRRRLAAPGDDRHRPHRADAAVRLGARRSASTTRRSIRTSGCSCRGSRRSPPPSSAGRSASSASWRISITCSSTARSTRSTCGCSTTR